MLTAIQTIARTLHREVSLEKIEPWCPDRIGIRTVLGGPAGSTACAYSVPLQRAMNVRYALILAITTALFLIGCTTTPDERHLERLMRHRSWPGIQQIAQTEVKKREILWP